MSVSARRGVAKVMSLNFYSFLIVASATFLLASAGGVVGTFNVLKGQALIGDAVGHATFPGVILFFMIFKTRDPLILSLGAFVAGYLADRWIDYFNRQTKLTLDPLLAVALSTFFGLGLVLKSYIAGNLKYQEVSQAGLSTYIFGQAAYLMEQDVKLLLFVAIFSLIVVCLTFRLVKVHLFDPTFSRLIGFPNRLVSLIIRFLSLLLIAVGLKLVGAILMAAFLVVPPIAALQWCRKLHHTLALSGAIGGVSAVIGTYLSGLANGLATGPCIIIIMCLFALASLILAPIVKGANRQSKEVVEWEA
ncbi:metal ABC transporter permease [Facklamia languida]